tara:strand:- start:655 stop:870 length:216 start_codon:yes stop_codon:yes gene_type:complete
LKNKKATANTVYKLWLGQSSLGKSCGFSIASFYLERFVLKHATAHIHNRWHSLKIENEKNNLHFNIDLSNF